MEIAIALIALTLMEIVLGIDNIIFITIVSGKLPEEQQPAARRIGLALALGMRLLLLFTLAYVVQNLTYALFNLTDYGIPQALIERLGGHKHDDVKGFAESNGVSWRDLILIGGGLFLVAKSIHEIHGQMHHDPNLPANGGKRAFFSVLAQIAVLDIVFSLDSVITAVGMVEEVWIMAVAIVVAVVVMLIFAEPISRFVKAQPTLKMLALSFLILIGVMLVAEGIGSHLDKGYVYFAMVFALIVEFLNIRLRKHVA
jgi:predicted tellurium resistance membrane protein TerC